MKLTKRQLSNYEIDLTLSAEEAGILVTVLRYVGGSTSGPRGRADAILKGLQEAGVTQVGYADGSINLR